MMDGRRGAISGDVLAHPLAALIRRLGDADEMGEDGLVIDVLSLVDIAGAEKPDPHAVAATVRLLREHLDAAQALAEGLPEWLRGDLCYVEPAGIGLGELIARTSQKVRVAERVASSLSARISADARTRKNENRDRVARACAEIFAHRTGAREFTAATTPDHTVPANPFAGFVFDVFLTLGLLDTPTAWFRPADKAAKEITAKLINK